MRLKEKKKRKKRQTDRQTENVKKRKCRRNELGFKREREKKGIYLIGERKKNQKHEGERTTKSESMTRRERIQKRKTVC